MKYFILFFFLMSSAFADDFKFRPDHWTRGLHLIAGGGANVLHFASDDEIDNIGYGLNFKTDLGYYFSNRFAVEWSTNVKFDRVEDYLVWDTLITFGLRYRINTYYIRGFYGKAPTVIFFDGNPPDEYENSSASRLQYDGPVFGVAAGKMYENKNGLVWFIEYSATYQRLDEREAIKMDGQVPIVVQREKDRSTQVSLYAMIGILIF